MMHELQSLNDIQLAWSGRLINVGNEIGSKIGYMQVNHPYDKEPIIPKGTKEICGTQKTGIAKDTLMNFIKQSQHFLSKLPGIYKKKGTACDRSGARSDCSEIDSVLYEETALALLAGSLSFAPSSSCTPSSTIATEAPQPVPVPLSITLKGWLTLLTAKTLLYAAGDHQKAYIWVRKSLNYMAPLGGGSNSFAKRGNLGMGGSCVRVDKCLARLEVWIG